MFSRMRHSWVWILALFSVASLIEAAFWNQISVFTPLYLPHLGITDPEDVKRWVGSIVTQGSILNMFPAASILTALGTAALVLAACQPLTPSAETSQPTEPESREQIPA
jgi:hypothetical protein